MLMIRHDFFQIDLYQTLTIVSGINGAGLKCFVSGYKWKFIVRRQIVDERIKIK